MNFIFQFFYFLFVLSLAFFIPGNLFIQKLNLKFPHTIIVSFVFGMVLWGWQGFIFGFLNVRFLSIVYILFCLFLWLRLRLYQTLLKEIHLPHFIKAEKEAVFLIILGVIVQTLPVWFMGIGTAKGLLFCCGAIEDFIYHMRLTDQVIQHIPPFEPDMYGKIVTNYHYLGNIVVGELVRVFHLPFFYTQFQFIGLFLSLFLGLLVWVFSSMLRLPKPVTYWLLFFLYFGGDLIFVLILLLGRGFHLEMGPLENGAAFLNNPPRAFAIVAFFAGIILFSLWIKTRKLYTGFLMAIVFGSTIGFKVYIGIFVLCGLLGVGIYFFFKRNFKELIPILLTCVFATTIYLPVNTHSGGLIFVGFWRFQEFIIQPALGLSHLELARQIFVAHNNWTRALAYDLFFMLLFVITIFGTKLLGIFQTRKSLSLFSTPIHIFLLSGIIPSLLVGFFFWQRSGGSNSFNFLVTVYILGSFYTALALYYWTKKLKRPFAIIVTVLIIALNIPRIGHEISKTTYKLQNNVTHVITHDAIEASEFISKQTPPESVIQTLGLEYYTFLGKRPIFLGNWGLLQSHDIDVSKQLETFKQMEKSTESAKLHAIAKRNNIDYLYLSSDQEIGTQSAFFKPVFQNKTIKVLKVL